MRKVKFYGAISLDGYLADQNNSLNWLFKYEDKNIMEKSYQPFIKDIDTTIMGRQTYDDLMSMTNEFPYSDMTNYVLTHRSIDSNEVISINTPIERLISKLKIQSGKDIWIIGGGKIVSTLIENHLIDSLQIQITPDILGNGVKLFTKMNSHSEFKLINSQRYDQFIDLYYELKGPTA
ncbi:dihydrofolate reductase family protein [Companilactobacillus baiquanensis]|uniref:Dihydrofolate reductase family protein n=1 Tax=Companilactobacillus baiquanensis TaxID=2486005 RepID=A0ABW1UTR7_9LACO|nr:dihydrofolate reductase family protein [Companilactobacillus baiquanensis]